MHTIFLTRRLFPEAIKRLRTAVRIGRPGISEGVITQLTDRIDSRFFDKYPRVRVVSQCAVGVDNIDLGEAARRGITVMNTPGVLTDATADMTWALILAVARRVAEADALCRSGLFSGWDLHFMLGKEVTGRTLGIIGPGRIGRAVAARAAGFRMNVLCCGQPRNRKSAPAGMTRVTLHRLLKESDFVSLHVPATKATHHLIGAAELALMKPQAILINTSRGTAVDEKALVAALRAGVLSGAGLDVFENEPRIPAALRRSRRVVLTPHIASATRETRGMMAMTAAQNIIDFFRGVPERSRVVTGL